MTSNDIPLSFDVSAWTSTLILFAAVSVVAYFFLFRNPTGNNENIQPPPRQQQQQQRRPAQQRRQPQGNTQAQQQRPSSLQEQQQHLSYLVPTRSPPHLHPDKGPKTAALSNGILTFKSCRAFGYESRHSSSSSDGDSVATNRKDRAWLLTKIVDSTAQLPARGGLAVVCIPAKDIACPKLHRILYLLGTYFNLFLVLVQQKGVIPEQNLSSPSKASLSLDGVPDDVLPPHRILFVKSITGRIALVRQLEQVEFVLDFDPQVKTELNRFGFRVSLYGGSTVQSKVEEAKRGEAIAYSLLAQHVHGI